MKKRLILPAALLLLAAMEPETQLAAEQRAALAAHARDVLLSQCQRMLDHASVP